ncbi:MAG: hypothetical protein ACOX47_01470 [Bacillota bacterium]|jgi:hypothetical protein
MRRRRRSRRDLNFIENLNENLEDQSDSLSESPKVSMRPEESSPSDSANWKDVDTETILKCEAEFFCQVLRRLLKELNCARNMDDLDDVISLSAKFLEASAAKEQAIAYQIAVSKGIHCPVKKKSNSKCNLVKDNKEEKD